MGKFYLFIVFFMVSGIISHSDAISNSDDYNPDSRQVSSLDCNGNVCIQKKVKKLKSRRVIPQEPAVESNLEPLINVSNVGGGNYIEDGKAPIKLVNSSSILTPIKDYFTNANLSGVYVAGGVIGVSNYNLHGNRFQAGMSNLGYTDSVISSKRTSFQIGIGYNKALPYHLLLGLEAYYMEPRTITNSNWNLDYTVSGSNVVLGSFNVHTNAKFNRSFGVKFRIGAHFWRIAVYGIIGYSCNMLTESNYTTSVPNGITPFSEGKSVLAHGFIYGGGAEIYVTDFMFVRFEYMQNQFAYNVTFNNIYVNNGTTGSVNAGTHWQESNLMKIGTMTGSIGFKFNL